MAIIAPSTYWRGFKKHKEESLLTMQVQIQGLGEFARWGFTLERSESHIVELCHQGELIARFSQAGVTEQRLQVW